MLPVAHFFRTLRQRARAALTSALAFVCLCMPGVDVAAQTVPEYALKAAVLYNFALFTEWPERLGDQLTLCVIGEDPFGAELDALQGEPVGKRTLQVKRLGRLTPLSGCQMLFVPRPSMANLPQILSVLNDAAVLTVADTPGAARSGIGINMGLQNARVVFEINLGAVRRSGLVISSKLLRLAQVVHD